MFDPATIVGGGAIMAALYAGWDYVKVYLSKVYSLFFVRVSLGDSDELKKAVVCWLIKNSKQSRFTIPTFTTMTDFVKPLSKNQTVGYEIPCTAEPTVYWVGNKPLVFSYSQITFLRGMFNPRIFIKEALDYYNSMQGDSLNDDNNNRFFIRKFHGTLQNGKNGKLGNDGYNRLEAPSPSASNGITKDSGGGFFSAIQNSLIPLGWKKEDIGQIKKPEPLSHLALSEETMKAIDEIRRWRKSEEWYKERQIPHKKGILMYGKPGTGKSSVAKALAMDLNMPIMIIDLTNMSNQDFQDAWDRIKNNSPCMVLLEDIDAVFDGRKNIVHEEGGLSFDCLLNCMDGIEDSSGILIVATTNNIDKIDVALGKPNGDGISTRPGRIDRTIELGNPTAEGRRKIANRILIDFPSEIERVVLEGEHDTGAQFQERCSRLALKLFWENKGK
jgi:hypothetical protein